MKRIAPGLYETTDGKYRVERVNDLARAEGWRAGWHLFESDGRGGWDYADTFARKADAVQAIAELH